MKHHSKKFWRVFFGVGMATFAVGMILTLLSDRAGVFGLVGNLLVSVGLLLSWLTHYMPALEQAGKIRKIKLVWIFNLIALAMILGACFLGTGRYVLMGSGLLLSIVTMVAARWNEPYEP